MVAEKLTKRDNFIIERVLFNFLFMLLGGNMLKLKKEVLLHNRHRLICRCCNKNFCFWVWE